MSKLTTGVQCRSVRLEKARVGQAKPNRAKIMVDGKSRDLGRFAMREAASASSQAERRVFPAKMKSAPPMSETIQESICSELSTGRASGRWRSSSR
jgi:hypothetical protein